MKEGVFPDPANCRKYYRCTDGAAGFTLDDFFCESLYVFDPSAPGGNYCRLTNGRYCVTVDCKDSTSNILMNYPFLPTTSGQFVTGCRGTGKKPLVYSCSAGLVAKLNTNPVECELNCRGAGKFAYDEDKTKYYECYWTGLRWDSKINNCFRGYIFDKTKRDCIVDPARKKLTQILFDKMR